MKNNKLKQYLLNIYLFSYLPKERENYYQKIARDKEWEEIKLYIKKNKFLDVGCGAGYAMKKAKEELNCECFGIDPQPQAHGVGRFTNDNNLISNNILVANSEHIPFNDNSFDTVFSSHVLEHVNNIDISLQEMKRVLKNDGILIIGVPTATMSFINWFTQIIFATHIKIINLLLKKYISTGKTLWWEIFIPKSHSIPNKTIMYDIMNYRVKCWIKTITKEFKINNIIYPALYPYPEFRQIFRLTKFKKISSSVFFICKKF